MSALESISHPVHRSFTLLELSRLLAAELHGNPDLVIRGVAPIESAGAGDLSFIANPRYASHAETTGASALLVAHDFPAIEVSTLRLGDPYLAFAQAIDLLHPAPTYLPGIHPTAVIAESAHIGHRAHIGPYVVVMENVIIGDDAVLLPHTVIYPGVDVGQRFFAHAHVIVRENCHLGDDVVAQSGAVIGSDGFGFAKNTDGTWRKIRQAGTAVLEDEVEVQANACIDRASVGETRIGQGSKVDNLVQVGHGSTVGRSTLLCAQVGLAGSTRIGDRVILAGQVGVAGHCTIGDDVVATAQSGIPGDVAAGQTVSGYPAVENRRWLRTVALLNRLPDVLRNLKLTQK